MKLKLFSLLSIVAVLVGLLGFTSVVQAGAYGQAFTSSITYQNLGPAPANISVSFYPAGSATPITIDLAPLNSMAGSSLYIGGVVSLNGVFTGGSAVMSSDQPLATTIVQVPGAAATALGIKSRPLTNGMDTGASTVQIPTVLANVFGSTSVFSVQNADAVAQNIDVQFIPLSAGTPYTSHLTSVPSGSGQSYDLGTMSGNIGATFNGSVKITGTGPIVATSIEYSLGAGTKAYGFEGTGTGGPTVYMPSAFCKWSGTLNDSAYAVQNTNASGNVVVTAVFRAGATTYTQNTVTIAAGQKASIQGCGVPGTPAGQLPPANFIGSAVLTATGGNIVAIGKVNNATLGTAFLGFTDGAAKYALPYVRWAKNADWPLGSKQRTNIAVQNIGAADLAAGAVTVTYYDKNGVLVGAPHALPALAIGGKASSNPTGAGAAVTEFGFYADNSTGGSAIVAGPAGSKLAVIARVETYLNGVTTAGEDYNGIPAP